MSDRIYRTKDDADEAQAFCDAADLLAEKLQGLLDNYKENVRKGNPGLGVGAIFQAKAALREYRALKEKPDPRQQSLPL